MHARIPVALYDPSSSVLSTGAKKFQGWLDKDVAKGRLSKEDSEGALSRFTRAQGDGTSGDKLADDTDLVVEAIPEIPDLKSGLFKRLAETLPPSAVLGSNTSSISLTRLARAAESGSQGAAERVVG